jgi:hypothetical protein
MAREPPRRSYLWRFLRGLLFAEFLLLATWGGSDYSYLSWLARPHPLTALQAVAGIALLIGHVALARIAFLSLDWLGVTASLALLFCVLLAAAHLGLIDLTAAQDRRGFWLFVAGVLIAAGLAWGSLQQRLSGERTVLKNPP